VEVSERSKRALRKTRILAMNPAKWLQVANPLLKLTHPILWTRFIRFALASARRSVHAVDDDLRKRLVPTTTERMVDLRDAFIDTFNFHRVSKAKRVLMIEYVLIDGVNDGEGEP